jgi:hypothetical protein
MAGTGGLGEAAAAFLASVALSRGTRRFEGTWTRASTLPILGKHLLWLEWSLVPRVNVKGTLSTIRRDSNPLLISLLIPGHDLGTPQESADPLVNVAKSEGMRGDYERWYSLDLEMCLKWRSIRKPVICAAKGFTIYHGAAVMSVADIVIAADDLKYMPSLGERSRVRGGP